VHLRHETRHRLLNPPFATTTKGETQKLTSGIQRIDVNTQIHRLLRAHPVPDLLDDALGADGVDDARLDDLEAAVAVVVVVAEAGERGADADVDVGVVGEEAFFVRVVEVRAVVDGGLFAGGTAEDFRAPGVAGDGVSC